MERNIDAAGASASGLIDVGEFTGPGLVEEGATCCSRAGAI